MHSVSVAEELLAALPATVTEAPASGGCDPATPGCVSLPAVRQWVKRVLLHLTLSVSAFLPAAIHPDGFVLFGGNGLNCYLSETFRLESDDVDFYCESPCAQAVGKAVQLLECVLNAAVRRQFPQLRRGWVEFRSHAGSGGPLQTASFGEDMKWTLGLATPYSYRPFADVVMVHPSVGHRWRKRFGPARCVSTRSLYFSHEGRRLLTVRAAPPGLLAHLLKESAVHNPQISRAAFDFARLVYVKRCVALAAAPAGPKRGNAGAYVPDRTVWGHAYNSAYQSLLRAPTRQRQRIALVLDNPDGDLPHEGVHVYHGAFCRARALGDARSGLVAVSRTTEVSIAPAPDNTATAVSGILAQFRTRQTEDMDRTVETVARRFSETGRRLDRVEDALRTAKTHVVRRVGHARRRAAQQTRTAQTRLRALAKQLREEQALSDMLQKNLHALSTEAVAFPAPTTSVASVPRSVTVDTDASSSSPLGFEEDDDAAFEAVTPIDPAPPGRTDSLPPPSSSSPGGSERSNRGGRKTRRGKRRKGPAKQAPTAGPSSPSAPATTAAVPLEDTLRDLQLGLQRTIQVRLALQSNGSPALYDGANDMFESYYADNFYATFLQLQQWFETNSAATEAFDPDASSAPWHDTVGGGVAFEDQAADRIAAQFGGSAAHKESSDDPCESLLNAISVLVLSLTDSATFAWSGPLYEALARELAPAATARACSPPRPHEHQDARRDSDDNGGGEGTRASRSAPRSAWRVLTDVLLDFFPTAEASGGDDGEDARRVNTHNLRVRAYSRSTSFRDAPRAHDARTTHFAQFQASLQDADRPLERRECDAVVATNLMIANTDAWSDAYVNPFLGLSDVAFLRVKETVDGARQRVNKDPLALNVCTKSPFTHDTALRLDAMLRRGHDAKDDHDPGQGNDAASQGLEVVKAMAVDPRRARAVMFLEAALQPLLWHTSRTKRALSRLLPALGKRTARCHAHLQRARTAARVPPPEQLRLYTLAFLREREQLVAIVRDLRLVERSSSRRAWVRSAFQRVTEGLSQCLVALERQTGGAGAPAGPSAAADFGPLRVLADEARKDLLRHSNDARRRQLA